MKKRFGTDPIVKIADLLGVVLFLVMVSVALLQVLFRFVLQVSVPWTEELARIIYVWIIFVGAILTESEDNQIKTTYFLHKLPVKARFAAQVVINAFCILFELCLVVGAVMMYRQSGTMNFGTMPFLPTSILYIPVIISCPLVIWYLVRQLLHYDGGKGVSDEAGQILQETQTGQEGKECW